MLIVYQTVGATPVGAAGGEGSAPGGGSYTPPKAADTVANPGANSGSNPPAGGSGSVVPEEDCYDDAPESRTQTAKDIPASATPELPTKPSSGPSTTANPGAGVVPEEDCDDDETTPALPVSQRPSNIVSSSAQPSATGYGSYGGYKRADAGWRNPL